MSSKRKHFHNRKGKHFNKPNQPKTPKEYRYKNQLTEADVGITEYLTEGAFSGIIKARYSDFQVNEIDLKGNIAKLTDTNCPEDFISNLKYNYMETEKTPLGVIPQDKWDAMKALAQVENGDPVYIDVESFDKSARKEIHDVIANYFVKTLVASTIEKEGKKVIEFRKYDKAGGQDIRMRWPEDKGKYVYFILYKEDMDTMEAISRISSALKMRNGNFTYAGTKDKRSKSTQWICIKKVFPKTLLSGTKNLMFIKIGNLSFRDSPLKLGQLQGNKFRIALRNVTAEEEVVNNTMEAIKKTGFINYYGLQRFGNNKEVTTFDIGIKLLLGNWKEAVELILKPKQYDDPTSDLLKAKKIYFETGDAKKALAVIKRRKAVEELLLEGLSKGNANEYVNALESIPRNMRLMYLHSVQSLIWNKMVSKRIKLFGLQPVVGDLVVDNSDKLDQPADELAKESLKTKETSDDSDMDEDNNEKIEKGDVTKNDSEEREDTRCRIKVKNLTDDDLSSYTIYDIVLPLPGYDVIYPENMKEHYKEALEELGLSLEMPKQKVKTYTLSGDYRNILINIKDLSWKIMAYNNPTDNLILSDLEEMKGEKEPQSVENGQYKAVVLEFSLPSSCYATMVLREILKMNTSSSSQAKLNDYHIDKERKILIDNDVPDETPQESSAMNSESLLTDPDKFAAFKNSIFEDILGGTKRKNDEKEDGANKIQKLEQPTS